VRGTNSLPWFGADLRNFTCAVLSNMPSAFRNFCGKLNKQIVAAAILFQPETKKAALGS
jgi:hypothetical protein